MLESSGKDRTWDIGGGYYDTMVQVERMRVRKLLGQNLEFYCFKDEDTETQKRAVS